MAGHSWFSGRRGRPLGNLPELEIDSIRPAEADHILLVAARHLYLRIARYHVVFFTDGAVGGESCIGLRKGGVSCAGPKQFWR